MTDPTSNARLTELFESHYDEVVGYCARRIGRSEAEDAAADVFAIATRRVGEIDWLTVRPWLYGIARGVVSNRWRSIRRRQRAFGRVSGMADIPIDGPDDLVVRRAVDGEAIDALRSLKAADREVLMLAAWEELSGSQIAQALGISTAAAEQRLHRAKQRFARVIEPETRVGRRSKLASNDQRGG
ncbi:MAG TPA: sigma-70 family RNA polymerase sigma factor [Acidimicrobiia bacterium]|nr:sigma-70 family RNA polymerase sigma factor [Acidimicrobiia bacterium]